MMYSIFLAYGEYMAIMQMAAKCPTAQRIGKSYIRHWRLTFQGESGNGVENIVPAHNEVVPVTLWRVSEDDVKELDWRYRYMTDYTKLSFDVVCEGTVYSGYTYVLNNSLPEAEPAQTTKDIMKEGYSDNGISVRHWDPRFF